MQTFRLSAFVSVTMQWLYRKHYKSSGDHNQTINPQTLFQLHLEQQINNNNRNNNASGKNDIHKHCDPKKIKKNYKIIW